MSRGEEGHAGAARGESKRAGVASVGPSTRIPSLAIYSAAFFLLLILFAHLDRLSALAPIFGPLGAAMLGLLGILGLNELQAVRPYLERVRQYLGGRRIRLVSFLLVVWLPSLGFSLLIGACYVKKYSYEQTLAQIASQLRKGKYDNAIAAQMRDIIRAQPKRREIWLLTAYKNASLRGPSDDDEFRRFADFAFTAVKGTPDLREPGEVHLALAGEENWLTRQCTCEEEVSNFDPLISIARFTAEGLVRKLPPGDSLKLARAIVDAAPKTPLRELYVSMVDLELAKNDLALARDTSVLEWRAALVRSAASMEKVRTILTQNRHSQSFQEHDLYQQGWDFVGQYHIEECSARAKSSETLEETKRAIAQSFDSVLETRSEVGDRLGWNTPMWLFPPEKFLLYWHVVKLRGQTIPVRWVDTLLARWERECPGYRMEVEKVVQGYGEFGKHEYKNKWKEGTILIGDLNPESEKYVISDSLNSGWRF